MEVVIVKLLNNQEIMAELINRHLDHKYVLIKNPVLIVVMPGKPGQEPSVGLGKWSEFSESREFKINESAIVTVTKPIDEFVNQYRTMFGGVIVPTSKLILPN